MQDYITFSDKEFDDELYFVGDNGYLKFTKEKSSTLNQSEIDLIKNNLRDASDDRNLIISEISEMLKNENFNVDEVFRKMMQLKYRRNYVQTDSEYLEKGLIKIKAKFEYYIYKRIDGFLVREVNFTPGNFYLNIKLPDFDSVVEFLRRQGVLK